MSEDEKRLREWIRTTSGGGGPLSAEMAERCLDAALVEYGAQAWANALEEAAQGFDAIQGNIGAKRAAMLIRQRKNAGPPASIPLAKAREAMREGGFSEMQVAFVLRRLGVPLDGGEGRALKCPGCPCPVHETRDCPHHCEDV